MPLSNTDLRAAEQLAFEWRTRRCHDAQGPCSPALDGNNDGLVCDRSGHPFADTFGHEAHAAFIALAYNTRPENVISVLLTEVRRLQAFIE